MKKKTFYLCAAALFAAAVAWKYIQKRAAEHEGGEVTLGIDWNYLAEGGKPRAKRFIAEFRRGLQRFVRGYDDSIFKNFNDCLDLLIMEDLRYMITRRKGTPDLRPKEERRRAATDEEQLQNREAFTAALREMLEHFEQSRNPDGFESAREVHHQKALEMLARYYKHLWD